MWFPDDASLYSWKFLSLENLILELDPDCEFYLNNYDVDIDQCIRGLMSDQF